MNLPTRFSEKITVAASGCWVWTGRLDAYGYARCSWHDRDTAVHRVVYELTKGPIPAGLQVDHLCRNRACINPDHLEAVTQRENCLRGENPAAQNARKTHCLHGHEFTPENTRDHGRGRECRTCRRERKRRYYAARKAAA